MNPGTGSRVKRLSRRTITSHIDLSLPCVKQQGIAALTGKYENTDTAVQGIEQTVHGFYEIKYPKLARSRELEIRNAVDEVQQVFRRQLSPK